MRAGRAESAGVTAFDAVGAIVAVETMTKSSSRRDSTAAGRLWQRREVAADPWILRKFRAIRGCGAAAKKARTICASAFRRL
jgi:hypothetical protein